MRGLTAAPRKSPTNGSAVGTSKLPIKSVGKVTAGFSGAPGMA